MPVFEWDIDLQASEWDWKEAAGVLPDVCDVSEDFWRKFEELPDFGDDLESLLETAVCNNDPSNVLRHHDCMWAGVCFSKEHKSLVGANLPPPPLPPPPPQPPSTSSVVRQNTSIAANTAPTTTAVAATTTVTKPATTTSAITSLKNITIEKTKKEQSTPRRKGVIIQKTVGRSLLINSRSRLPEPTRPETPPSLSESEEDEKRTVSVVPVSEVTNQVSIRRPQQQTPHQATTNLNVQFDHNYDKSVRLDDLGVQTPSDSEEEEEEDDEEEGVNGGGVVIEEDDEDEDEEEEDEDTVQEAGVIEDDSDEEEIDVVSLNNNNSMSTSIRMRNQTNSLPYNPSRELRRELQDTMASAITTNKILSVNRSVNRRINNTTSNRRKRKRGDTDDDEDDEETIVINQNNKEVIINSRLLASANSTIVTASNTNYHTSTSPRYHQQHHRRTWRRTAPTAMATITTASTKKSRFSTDSETDCEKRSLHNNMERMRRIGLRNAFEDLRVLVPSLKESKRAAKVNILKDSAVYVRQLITQERTLTQKVVSLRHEQEKLRTRLSKLRRSLAAQR